MKLTIKQKLIGSFLIVALIFSITSYLSFYNMKKTNETYDYILDNVTGLTALHRPCKRKSALEVGSYRGYMLYGEDSYKEEFL